MSAAPKRILIIKASALGDIVQTFPAVALLRKKLPTAQIDWVVEAPYAPLVRAHPEVQTVYEVHSQEWRRSLFFRETRDKIRSFRKELQQTYYDWVFDFQGNIKSGLLLAMTCAAAKIGFGWRNVSEWPNLFFTQHRYELPLDHAVQDEYLNLVRQYTGWDDSAIDKSVLLKISAAEEQQIAAIASTAHPARMKLMICPASRWANKQLPEETWVALLQQVAQTYPVHLFFIWGSEAERQLAHRLQAHFAMQSTVVEKLSLPALQNLMGMMELVLSVDSVALHLCATTATPTFSIFGASAMSKYKPAGEQHLGVQGVCPYKRTFQRRCAILRSCKSGACMRDATADLLFQELMRHKAFRLFEQQRDNLMNVRQ